MKRRTFLTLAAGSLPATAVLTRAARAGMPDPTAATADVIWHDVVDWGVEGKAFSDTEDDFDRLPGRARQSVRNPVWDLSRHSAGMLVRFSTDANAIHVRYRLRSERLAMPHMAATGVSGLDLYAKSNEGRLRWLAVVAPTAREMAVVLVRGLKPGQREYRLYLPLYNGVEWLRIGVADDAALTPLPPRETKPVVFYGTSIMQGACASRPGMAFPSIIGRRLDRPIVNLGFSGNGKMEEAIGALLVEIDAAVYVIDCLPNMNGSMVNARAEPLVRQIRATRPDTPIMLVEDRSFPSTSFVPDRVEHHRASRAALREAYERLQRDGIENIHYVEGEMLLGDDGEATVDGSRPSDLGMVRYADALTPVIRTIIAGG